MANYDDPFELCSPSRGRWMPALTATGWWAAVSGERA